MNHDKFDYLNTTFGDQKELIEKSIEQDRDFRQLCEDYEELGETLSCLRNLMKVPVEQIEKQISAQQELFYELEKEIAFHLEKEVANG